MYYTALVAMGVVQKPVKVSIVIAASLMTAIAAPAVEQGPLVPEPGFTALRIDSRFRGLDDEQRPKESGLGG